MKNIKEYNMKNTKHWELGYDLAGLKVTFEYLKQKDLIKMNYELLL